MQIITLTKAAQEKIQSIILENPEFSGLYIYLTKGGCAGMEYKTEPVIEQPIGSDAIQIDNCTIYIARDSILYLLGTEIDYKETILKSGFVFKNPNQTSSCGCGESVSIQPAKSPS